LPAGEKAAAVEDLEHAGHAPHLPVEVFLHLLGELLRCLFSRHSEQLFLRQPTPGASENKLLQKLR